MKKKSSNDDVEGAKYGYLTSFFCFILPSIGLLASFVVMFGFGWGNHFDSAVAHWEVCCSYKKESDDYTSKSGG